MIRILWVGRIQGLKALPIALHALVEFKHQFNFEFIIIGDGPDELACKKLSIKLGLNDQCKFKGRISNKEVIEIMLKSSFLLFTSLKEGTPHVVTEAIQNGLPVICHDSCGQGSVINDSCGIKIPLVNFSTSVKLFCRAIARLSEDKILLNTFSQGALARAKELTWDSKASNMNNDYKKVIYEYLKNI